MVSKSIPELKRLSALERGSIDKHPADYTVALVYPNSYYVGMSNLGFQLVYRLLNMLPGIRCERGFYAPGCETHTVESLRSLRSFDCVAFSLSYELDYFNVVEILRRAGINPAARKRDERCPLIMGGGVCAWLNPEPLADILDLFVIGEAEAVVGGLFDRLKACEKEGRAEILRCLADVPGVYVPRLFEPIHDRDGELKGIEALHPAVCGPERQWLKELDPWPALAPVVTPETDFGGRAMVEIMRGCGRQCRFCVADYAYRAPRLRSEKKIIDAVAGGLAMAKGIALLGPSPSDHPELEEVCAEILRRGGSISLSSLRADRVSDRLLDLLVKGGLKSITVAPESPSGHLQRRVNKCISADQVMSIAERAGKAGLVEVKLYYMIGVAGESEGDLEAIIKEVGAVALQIPVRVSAGPLVPKARTPLQWMAMGGEAELKKKWRFLKKGIEKIPRARMSTVSVREAVVEATLARGDRKLSRYLMEGRLPRQIRERYAERERNRDEIFPWEHIGVGVNREYLLGEYDKFLRGELSPACQTDRCRACGVCG